jgi:hypothetical protein
MIGKPYSGKLNVRFEVAGDGEVLWRTYTGTKLETADTAKGTPNVTRHSLTLPEGTSRNRQVVLEPTSPPAFKNGSVFFSKS